MTLQVLRLFQSFNDPPGQFPGTGNEAGPLAVLGDNAVRYSPHLARQKGNPHSEAFLHRMAKVFDKRGNDRKSSAFLEVGQGAVAVKIAYYADRKRPLPRTFPDVFPAAASV